MSQSHVSFTTWALRHTCSEEADLWGSLAWQLHYRNMNQLFLYVVATYNDTEANKRNEALVSLELGGEIKIVVACHHQSSSEKKRLFS